MTLADIDRLITAGMAFLPPAMDSNPARIMLMAIGLQESRFVHRKQLSGPARGFWQFEQGGGVAGVMSHRATAAMAREALQRLQYPQNVGVAYNALADNDILAVIFARLLLYSLPEPLPTTSADGWAQYIKAWRPGKPHPATWAGFYAQAEGFYRDR